MSPEKREVRPECCRDMLNAATVRRGLRASLLTVHLLVAITMLSDGGCTKKCDVPASDTEDDSVPAVPDVVRDLFELQTLGGQEIKIARLVARRSVTDISAIAGMKLEEVWLWKSGVEDISSLAGMPIRTLIVLACPVKDLSPLAGLPLEYLWIGETKVTDLSPLEGMPLETLRIKVAPSGKITDLTPLKDMKLKRLEFHANTITEGMDIIRNMESLEEIRILANGFEPEY